MRKLMAKLYHYTAVREELRRVNVQMNKQGMRVSGSCKKMSIKKQFIQLKMKRDDIDWVYGFS